MSEHRLGTGKDPRSLVTVGQGYHRGLEYNIYHHKGVLVQGEKEEATRRFFVDGLAGEDSVPIMQRQARVPPRVGLTLRLLTQFIACLGCECDCEGACTSGFDCRDPTSTCFGGEPCYLWRCTEISATPDLTHKHVAGVIFAYRLRATSIKDVLLTLGPWFEAMFKFRGALKGLVLKSLKVAFEQRRSK